MPQYWNKQSIAREIAALHEAGERLNYKNVEAGRLALLRAAIYHFGTWRAAVEAAGLDYDQIRRYQRWSRERILARIRELHAAGADLSWRSACLHLDPPLAAAAVKEYHFGSWGRALEAAGLDPAAVRRYREWDDGRVVEAVRAFHAAGQGLSAKRVTEENGPLIHAARRHFESWPRALAAAGLEPPPRDRAGRLARSRAG